MRRLALTIAVLAALGISGAHAEYIVNFAQVGNNVVATGSGTLDLSGLTFAGTGSAGTGIIPAESVIGVGPTQSVADYYSGVVGPTSFGVGGSTVSSATTGDFAGLDADSAYLAVPLGFVSGSSLSGSDTFVNATFASLGLTPGSYTYEWSPPNVTDDSFVINIPATAVPEPATLALLAAPLAAFLFAKVRRRRSFRG